MPASGGTRLRDPGGNTLPQRVDAVAALGHPLAADPAQTLQSVLEGTPDGGTATRDTALLRLGGQDRFEVGVLVVVLISTLQAGTFLVEVQDGARAA